ncbi:hypothetical protein M758_6G118200 [Ceratodon purpureus]|nr:hypothetical protein M758_6G118200 [Ceratodon purpureus]
MAMVNVEMVVVFLLVCVSAVGAGRNPMFSVLDVGGRGGDGDVDHPMMSILEEGGESGVEENSAPVRAVFDLHYHSGPLLSGPAGLDVYVIWYGSFSSEQRSTILDFFASFQESADLAPSVSSWWKTTAAYKDFANTGVAPSVKLAGETSITGYSLGRKLTRWEIEFLVLDSLNSFAADSKSVYLVLTADDVLVDGFCRSSCASHSFVAASAITRGHQLPYAWVGNAATQCPGKCAWPFALPLYGPKGFEPLVAPNGDVGADGMIINIANMLAGTATDPYINAWYQGDAGAPLEAGTACAGIYGEGAYPGFPGELLKEHVSGASYNVGGVNKRKFLLPALWDPVTRTCAPPS